MGVAIKEIHLQLEGITCTGCAEDIQTILREKEGILDASVNFAEGKINIRYDAELIGQKQILLTVSRLGFKTNILSGPQP